MMTFIQRYAYKIKVACTIEATRGKSHHKCCHIANTPTNIAVAALSFKQTLTAHLPHTCRSRTPTQRASHECIRFACLRRILGRFFLCSSHATLAVHQMFARKLPNGDLIEASDALFRILSILKPLRICFLAFGIFGRER